MKTHAELVEIAAEYARTTLDCGAVITEKGERYGEIPDVFAMSRTMRKTCILEAKATAADYAADAKKRWRQDPGGGVGAFRWFICDEDIIFPDAVKPPWGLLYINPDGSVREVIEPVHVGHRSRDVTKELMLLAFADRWRAPQRASKGSRHSTQHQAFLDAVVLEVNAGGEMYASEVANHCSYPSDFKRAMAAADFVVKAIESGRETRIRTFNQGGRPMLSPLSEDPAKLRAEPASSEDQQ